MSTMTTTSLLLDLDLQLILPIALMFVLAFLTYFFGFQMSQEPSLEQLAVLKSGGSMGRSGGKSVNPTQGSSGSNSSSNNKKDKTGSSANVGQPSKDRVKVVIKDVVKDKENQKPKVIVAKPKKTVEKDNVETGDLESGAWTPVISTRKDKKNKVVVNHQQGIKVGDKKGKAQQVANENDDFTEMLSIDQVMKISRDANVTQKVLKEIVEIDTTPTTTQPEEIIPVTTKDEIKKKKNKTQAGDKKKVINDNNMTQNEVVVNGDVKVLGEVELQTQNQATVEEEQPLKQNIIQPPKEINNSKAKSTPAQVEANNNNSNSNSNVAFDEMGDLWEEAKSRGNKKKSRARRD